VALGVMMLAAGGCAAAPEGAPQPASGAQESSADRFRKTVERSALRERAISELLGLAVSADAQSRANALEALLPATARLRGPVAAGLSDENEGVRAVAAVVAGRAKLRESEPALRALASDSSPFVRASALFALRNMGAEVDLTPLGAMLLEHPVSGVRAHAAFLIGELGDESAMPMLRQALHTRPSSSTAEEDRLVGLQIAEAMVKLGDRERLEGIRAALYPSHPGEMELATLAVQILGRLNDRASVAQLISLSEYRQGDRGMPGELRLAVADAVSRMGRREAWFIAEEYLKDPDPLRRALSAHVLGKTGRVEDLEILERLLGDPSPAVRLAAAGSVLTATADSPGRVEASVEP